MSNAATTVQVKQTAVVPKGKLRLWIAVFCFLAYFVAFLDRVNVSVLIADPVFTKTFGIATAKSTQGLLMSFFVCLWRFLLSGGSGHPTFRPEKKSGSRAVVMGIVDGRDGCGRFDRVHFVMPSLARRGRSRPRPRCLQACSNVVPDSRTGKGKWSVVCRTADGMILATPLVAWWVSAVGWRGSYYILALLGLAPVVLCVYFVYDHPSKHPRITEEEANYIAPQSKDPSPAATTAKLDLGFLKSATFWYLVIIYGITNAGIWGFLSWIPSYLKSTLGFSWAAMGSLAILPYLCGTLSVMVFTPLMDRYNRRALFTFLGSVIFAMLVVVAMRVASPLAALAVLSLAYAAGGPRVPALFTMLQNVTSKEQVATATGFFNGIAYVFASLTPYAIGVLYNLTGSLKTGFYFLAALSVLAFLLCIPLVRQRL